MDELRTMLHALADRVAAGLEARGATDGAVSSEVADRAALITALAALAEGDLSRAQLGALAGSVEGRHLTAAVNRMRELVAASRASAGAGTEKIDEVRSAAERASDAASRQRVALDRASEQLRNLGQRSSELAGAAAEFGDTAERSAMLSLNVGIEGLRVGGEVARALGGLGEELRKMAQRGASGARELADSLRAVGEQLRLATTAVDEARVAARLAGEEAARAAGAAEGARRADVALGEAAMRFRLLDEDSDALVAELSATAGRIATARARLARLDPSAREAIEKALEQLRASAGGSEPPRT